MRRKLITKGGCLDCEIVINKHPDLAVLDIESPDAMAEMAMHGLMEGTLPILLTERESGTHTTMGLAEVLKELEAER